MILVSHYYEACFPASIGRESINTDIALKQAENFVNECNALDKNQLLRLINTILQDAHFHSSPTKYIRDWEIKNKNLLQKTAALFIKRNLLNIYN